MVGLEILHLSHKIHKKWDKLQKDMNQNIKLTDIVLFCKSKESILKKIILGIDPGTVVMGYSVISSDKSILNLLDIGVLRLNKETDTLVKLKKIYD